MVILTDKIIAGLPSGDVPSWLRNNTHYEVIMGSEAYGVSTDSSDLDIYGFCIPPKHIIFPHLDGEIPGFGRQHRRFEQYQKHHTPHPDNNKKLVDLTVFSIVKYFDLCMECNPNMIDSLFVPQRCVLHCSNIAQRVRENRNLFLSKKAWHTYKGYAYSQAAKIRNKENRTGARKEAIAEQGYDWKFAYHCIRLMGEVEEILTQGTLTLDSNREQLKSIRRGEWSEEQFFAYFETKERDLESLYLKSELRHTPDEAAVKALLLECLHTHFGDISEAVVEPDLALQTLREIKDFVNRQGERCGL